MCTKKLVLLRIILTAKRDTGARARARVSIYLFYYMHMSRKEEIYIIYSYDTMWKFELCLLVTKVTEFVRTYY